MATEGRRDERPSSRKARATPSSVGSVMEAGTESPVRGVRGSRWRPGRRLPCSRPSGPTLRAPARPRWRSSARAGRPPAGRQSCTAPSPMLASSSPCAPDQPRGLRLGAEGRRCGDEGGDGPQRQAFGGGTPGRQSPATGRNLHIGGEDVPMLRGRPTGRVRRAAAVQRDDWPARRVSQRHGAYARELARAAVALGDRRDGLRPMPPRVREDGAGGPRLGHAAAATTARTPATDRTTRRVRRARRPRRSGRTWRGNRRGPPPPAPARLPGWARKVSRRPVRWSRSARRAPLALAARSPRGLAISSS